MRYVQRARRAASLALALLLAPGTYAQQDQDSNAVLLEKMRQCSELSQMPRFDSIRRVFPLGREVTEEMLGAEAVASKVQLEALRAYRATVVSCIRRLAPDTARSDVARRAQAYEDLLLDLLIAGKITFAGYALIDQVGADRNRFWAEQVQSAHASAMRAPRPITGLVCTFENAEIRGLELFVQFDENTRQVWVSRGGAIARSWIDATSIGYQQGDSTFVISRLTGRINWTGSGTGILGTGQCVMATSQKF